MKRTPPFLIFATVGFCVWQARDLFNAWRYAPFDRFDPLAFVVWLLPVVAARIRRRDGFPLNPTVLLLAAGTTMLGSTLDLNVLQNLALAAALGSFVVCRASLVPWLLAAPAWMPVFGWVGSGGGFAAVAAMRLTLAGVASAWGWFQLMRPEPAHAA